MGQTGPKDDVVLNEGGRQNRNHSRQHREGCRSHPITVFRRPLATLANAIYPELRYLIVRFCISRLPQPGSPDDRRVSARLPTRGLARLPCYTARRCKVSLSSRSSEEDPVGRAPNARPRPFLKELSPACFSHA